MRRTYLNHLLIHILRIPCFARRDGAHAVRGSELCLSTEGWLEEWPFSIDAFVPGELFMGAIFLLLNSSEAEKTERKLELNHTRLIARDNLLAPFTATFFTFSYRIPYADVPCVSFQPSAALSRLLKRRTAASWSVGPLEASAILQASHVRTTEPDCGLPIRHGQVINVGGDWSAIVAAVHLIIQIQAVPLRRCGSRRIGLVQRVDRAAQTYRLV